ncbi:MAG: hypothetical protein ABIZ07_10905 [Dermatophilaceae bacterium]
MSVRCRTAGVTVRIDSANPAWLDLAREACAGQEIEPGPCDVDVFIAATGGPDRAGLHPVTRGASAGAGGLLLTDACGSGLDLHLWISDETLHVIAWPHPTWQHRGLGALAPDRRILLHRAALIQYPALWWAGVRGLVPLHVSAARVGGIGVLLAGPGGVGKSTLLATLAPTDIAVSDNVCAADARTVHGLLEPTRAEQGTGRRMPHGRREQPWERRTPSLAPQRIIVLRRGGTGALQVHRTAPDEAARELTAGTYAAGELRRYWAFAATLALGLGRGPAHPSISTVSDTLARSVPCYEAVLGARGTTLDEIVARCAGGTGQMEAAGQKGRRSR